MAEQPELTDPPDGSGTFPRPSWKKKVGGLLQLGLVGLIIFYLGHNVWLNWEQICRHPWHLNWGWLASSVVLQILSLMIMAWGWYAALRLLGARINPWHAQRIWIVTNFLKYLPGKIWLVLARVLQAQRHGIAKIVTLTSFAYEYVLFMAAGILVSAGTVPFWLHQGEARAYWWTLLLVPATLIGFHPAIFGPILNFALKKTKRPPLAQQISFPRLLLLLLLFSWAWLLLGLAFCLFVHAVYPLPLRTWPTLAGAFGASFVLGLLFLFTPGGLGVREAMLMVVMTSLGGTYLTAASAEGIAVVLALGSRVWMVLAEVLALGLGLAFIRDPTAPAVHLHDLADPGETLQTEE